MDIWTRPLEQLAADWLLAESRVSSSDGSAGPQAHARELSAAYDRAVNEASPEELRLAWESAVRIQSECEIGSHAWADARRVAELLRSEYHAARPTEPSATASA
jgi:hypothetical protein